MGCWLVLSQCGFCPGSVPYQYPMVGTPSSCSVRLGVPSPCTGDRNINMTDIQGDKDVSPDKMQVEKHINSDNSMDNIKVNGCKAGDEEQNSQTDLEDARITPVKSWVLRKRDCFERMSTSNQKSSINFTTRKIGKSTEKIVISNQLSEAADRTLESHQDETLEEKTENMVGESMSNVVNQKHIAEEEVTIDKGVSPKDHFEKSAIPQEEKSEHEETLKDPIATQEYNEDNNQPINSKHESTNLTQEKDYIPVRPSFLSRDEAIKLSTNASGTSQPRLSTKPGSKLLIKHEEYDSTCEDDVADKIQDKNVEKVYSKVSYKNQEADSRETNPGYFVKSISALNDTKGVGIKPAPIQSFASKDPVVKKMVYNQYREMLRKYTQSSRH